MPMPPEDNLHDLLQIDVPDIASSEEERVSPRDADLLNSLRVASPCNAAWDEMEGDDLVRFCQHCRKNVYNLSGMSRWDAAAFIRETEGQLCVRFYRRQDGTLLTDNCPVGWRAARRWLLKCVGSVAAAALGLSGVLSPLQGSIARSPVVPPPPVLGTPRPIASTVEVTPHRRRRRRRSRHGRRR
jgi:hypothetical protein